MPYPRIIAALGRARHALKAWVEPNIAHFLAERLYVVWALALVIGLGAGVGAILFREAIGFFQLPWLGTRSEFTLRAAANLSWWTILLAPAAGGLVVGILLSRISARRTGGVADVIEARALSGSKLGLADGLWSALVSAISVGAGASVGREGPVVHLGATLGAAISRRTSLPGWSHRTLFSAGVASAIAASFNAPIAGALFAHEVILGHYAVRSFVPIVIASVSGSILGRLWFGPDTAFIVPSHDITSYWEFPGFILLGVVCAVVAVFFQLALFVADFAARRINVPLWIRPVAGGLLVGSIAIVFPHVLGVGYEVTTQALWGELPLTLAFTLIFVKTIATAISLASRFGGGVFSPALVVGALTGGSFGIAAGALFPEIASNAGLYAMLGMGAVAGAVLGAPISTAMIVFELTGGYALSIALLLTVVVAQGLTQAFHGHSWFHWQLRMRGIIVQGGPHKPIGASARVMDFMDPLAPDQEKERLVPERGTVALKPTDTLDAALRAFDHGGHRRLPVVDPQDGVIIIAWANHLAALQHFNRALIQASEEEHR